MYTKTEIHRQMSELGIRPDDIVLTHTSMKAVGAVEGGVSGFLEMLASYFDGEGDGTGLLLIPTHTWANLPSVTPTLDMTSPKTCIGLLPDTAAAHPKGFRSLHPTHSITAFGAGAEEFIMGEVLVDTPAHPRGCYGKLYQKRGKILLCGVGHNRNTYLHCCEEMLGVENRLSPDLKPATIRLRSGDLIERPLHCHEAKGCPDVSAHYPKLEPAFRRAGAIRDGSIGGASAQLCDCVTMYDVMARIHAAHPGELFFDDAPLEKALLQAAVGE